MAKSKQQRQKGARAKPRIADPKRQAPTAKVVGWFDNALGNDDRKPLPLVCERLARKFQEIINRHNNAERERAGPVDLSLLKDVSSAEEINKRVRKITARAKQMLADVSELEDFNGGYRWGTISLEDVEEILERIIASPEASAALETQIVTLPSSSRRPREAWHATGREIAPLIQKALRDVGYDERLRMEDEESVTAQVGANVISWAYNIKIEAAGFASAMKDRDRSSKTKKLKRLTDEERFKKRFPGAARIKIIQ